MGWGHLRPGEMIGHYLVQSRLFRALHGDQSYPFRFLCGKPGLFRL